MVMFDECRNDLELFKEKLYPFITKDTPINREIKETTELLIDLVNELIEDNQIPISFEYAEYKETVNVPCHICGEVLSKTISVKHRKDMIPDYGSLYEQKQTLKKERHICNSCRKKIIGKVKNYLITEWIKNNYKQEKYLHYGFAELSKLKGKILKRRGKEYLIESISRSFYHDSFNVSAYHILKDKPYQLGRLTEFFTKNANDWKIVDDTLANRIKRYKQLKDEYVNIMVGEL